MNIYSYSKSNLCYKITVNPRAADHRWAGFRVRNKQQARVMEKYLENEVEHLDNGVLGKNRK